MEKSITWGIAMKEAILINNIYYMLSYAYQSLQQENFKSLEREEFDDAIDLFTAILIKGISRQLKRGLHKEYRNEKESLLKLRGKIDIPSSMALKHKRIMRLSCSYDDLSEDNFMNQIIKLTMLRLLSCQEVKKDNKEELRKLLFYFTAIQSLEGIKINWKRLHFPKNNSTYYMLMEICRLINEALLPSAASGESKMMEFKDSQQMSRLYEKFVLEFYKRHYPKLKPAARNIRWNADHHHLLPVMKTDITLQKGINTLIIDTKYYQQILTQNWSFDKWTLHSQNLYQIFSYVKNMDTENTGNVSGLLLYAKTDKELAPDEDYQISGNKICVKTLDLNQPFQNIKSQLEEITEMI